jgi:hypothetical protein
MPSKKRAHLQQFGIIHLSNINLTYIRSPERENYVYALLVEIGPEGGRRHNSPRNASLPSLLSRSYFRYSRRGKEMRNYLTEQEMQQGNTCRPKTERLAVAFSALFSLQYIRSITRVSLFIGVPWVWSFASITPFSFLTNGFKHFTRA